MQQYVSTRYYFDRPMKSRQLCASSQRRPPVSSIQGASTARLQSLQAPDRLPQLAEVAFEYFRHRSSMPMPSCDVWQPLEALCLLVWRVCSFFITLLFMSKPKRLEEKKYGTQTREIKLRDLIIRGKVTLDVSDKQLTLLSMLACTTTYQGACVTPALHWVECQPCHCGCSCDRLFHMLCACMCGLHAAKRCDCRLGKESDSGGEQTSQPAQAHPADSDRDIHRDACGPRRQEGTAPTSEVLKLTWQPDTRRPDRPLSAQVKAKERPWRADCVLVLNVCARM